MKLLPSKMGLGVLSNAAFLYWDPLAATSSHHQHNGFSLFFAKPIISPFFAFTKKTPVQLTKKQDVEIGQSAAEETVKIGIVGGGMCGNAVAHALAKQLASNPESKKNYKIIVLEGDPNAPAITEETDNQRSPPKWHAAAARNANSIVPGSSMHVFSKKSAIWQIAHDTIEEWYFLTKEWFQSKVNVSSQDKPRREDFAVTPPYFAVHPWKCLGPSATSDERATFLRFIKHFLYYSVVLGDEAASQRGNFMCQLAKANRDLFLNITQEMNQKGHNIQYSRGFLALYRDSEAAKKSQQTTLDHGEEAQLLSWEEAVQKVPKLDNLPMKPLSVVHRPNEIVSSCEEFIRAWTREIYNLGVRYHHGRVNRVDAIRKNENKFTYRVTYEDESKQDFDLLVLAAGVYSPVIATQMGVGNYVPTYPLRGYSLTTFEVQPSSNTTKPIGGEASQTNLLPKPFSVDSMYCTSVTPHMARWAGFGEFVGYPPKDEFVPSAAPSILSRYSRSVFPDAESGLNKEDALRCYRPASPDDLPIVGSIPKLPGFFVHTGHGTLGWTTGLATGFCLAQVIAEHLGEPTLGELDQMYYHLPNGICIERKLLSPDRFVDSK